MATTDALRFRTINALQRVYLTPLTPYVCATIPGTTQYGTPYNAIMLNGVATLILSRFSFASLAEVDMLFYNMSTLMKFAALVRLRYMLPDADRPFKIPLGNKVRSLNLLWPDHLHQDSGWSRWQDGSFSVQLHQLWCCLSFTLRGSPSILWRPPPAPSAPTHHPGTYTLFSRAAHSAVAS